VGCFSEGAGLQGSEPPVFYCFILFELSDESQGIAHCARDPGGEDLAEFKLPCGSFYFVFITFRKQVFSGALTK